MAPSPGLRVKGYMLKALMYAWLGQKTRSQDDLKLAADLAGAENDQLLKAHAERLKGWISFENGNTAVARHAFKTWFDFLVEYRPTYEVFFNACYQYYLGMCDVRDGRIDSARSRFDELEAQLPQVPIFQERIEQYIRILNIEILLAEGSYHDAIETGKTLPAEEISSMSILAVLRHNVPFRKDFLARAYVGADSVDCAIRELERLVSSHSANGIRSLVHPEYHFRLAQLYMKKDEDTKAKKEYNTFIDIWKDSEINREMIQIAEEQLRRFEKSF